MPARARVVAAALISILLAAGCSPPSPAAAPAAKAKYEAPDERYVFFAAGKTEVLSDGFFSLGYVVALLDADASLRVLVVGHADPHGNRDIGLRRAQVVRRALTEHGIKEARVTIATPRDQSESSLSQLSRRADLYVYDPARDAPQKRVGYALDIKSD